MYSDIFIKRFIKNAKKAKKALTTVETAATKRSAAVIQKYTRKRRKRLIKESLYIQKVNLFINIDKKSIPLYLLINFNLIVDANKCIMITSDSFSTERRKRPQRPPLKNVKKWFSPYAKYCFICFCSTMIVTPVCTLTLGRK